MRGDFTRIRFAPAKHYTSVLQQQGRVALDADANEQAAIYAYIRDAETGDIIGPYGGPFGDEGFAISVSGNAIMIGPGRYYVQGILCENEQSLPYSDQAYLVNPNPTDAALLAELSSGTARAIRVWLEVWQRLVTALDDGCLRDPALGQADTTTRVQTIWRVVAEAVPASTSGSHAAAAALASPGAPIGGADPMVTRTAMSGAVERAIGRIPIPVPFRPPFGPAFGPPFPRPPFPRPVPFLDCCKQMYEQATVREVGGALSAQTGNGSDECSCQPTPSAGYRGLENQLYRVEIHEGGDETTARFKWSRENGSIVAAVTSISGANVQVDSLGPDANLGFQAGQWVELIDDSYLFGQSPQPGRLPYQPGKLYQIQGITPETLTITMSQPVSLVDTTRNPRLRRWDQFGPSVGSSGVSLSAESWLDLENGIQIQFTKGSYATGDHWLIPARTATGQIEWPPCESDGATFQPAYRAAFYRAPLACLHWDSKAEQVVPEDCRRVFSPLTALTPSTPPQALHVTAISWTNDDVMTFDQLLATRLTLQLDQAPTGNMDGSNFVVSLELAVPTEKQYRGATEFTGPAAVFTMPAARAAAPVVGAFIPPVQFTPTIVRQEWTVDGQITVQGQTITWQIPYQNVPPSQLLIIQGINSVLLQAAPFSEFARVRIRLVGRAIFLGSAPTQAFLDGQSFGTPGVRADGVTPRIDLQVPSGNLEKASDFESWFYLAPIPALTKLAVQPPAVNVLSSGTVITAVPFWQPNTAYAVGSQVLAPISNLQTAVVAGTSGQTTPGWKGTVGQVTADNTVTWQCTAPTPVSPLGTVTLNYPAVANTVVNLSVQGPAGGGTASISVQASVTVVAGRQTATFPIAVQGNPGSAGETFTIQATLTLTSTIGHTFTQTATFSVTGFTVIL